ncbi:hypothetical protein IWW34DRAFT_779983 [Fusarium oxysporum f. sp. albedinis]|uniref:Uncharacterized protein n=2 Tax=Fusarium oxysporum TaxID=5507 RepID=N4UGI7_FUSC1
MQTFNILFITLATAVAGVTSSSSCPPFPASMTPFSYGFKEPKPPAIKPEYQAHFVQHKWNGELSHITAGFIQNSPSKGFVRADEAFDGVLASSTFDYSNVTKLGLVDNTLITYDPKKAKPSVWRGYVNSNYPILNKTVLIDNGAVFEGFVKRDFTPTPVAAWSIMYQNAIPVTVFVNECGVIVGYDYFAPELRTRVIMEFFNIQAK